MPRTGRFLARDRGPAPGFLRGVPTLVVTALTMTPQEVREAGVDAYLRKPVDPTMLCQTVRTLARRGTQASA